MDLYEKQQFSFFLQTATERCVTRLEERFRGPDAALEHLQADPEGDGVQLSAFTDALFEDFLLNSVDGACFVLSALPNRHTSVTEPATVEETLIRLAKTLFTELLVQKTTEALEQRSRYQSV